MPNKKCPKCSLDKDHSEFNKAAKAKDGLQAYCRQCSVARATAQYGKYPHKTKQRNKEYVKVLTTICDNIKLKYGCFNCGYKEYAICLDFHHLNQDEKDTEVSLIARYKNITRLINEINKCVVTCSNCHRLIHKKIIECNVKPCLEKVDEHKTVKQKQSAIKKQIVKIDRRKIKREYKAKPDTRKVIRPTKEELEKLLWEKPTTQIAKDYGLSDNGVAKWVKSYGLTKPPRGYWVKQKCILGT